MSSETIEHTVRCKICRQSWQIKEFGYNGYLYHSSFGVVCANHRGVKNWYDALVEKKDALPLSIIDIYIKSRGLGDIDPEIAESISKQFWELVDSSKQ